MNIEFARPWALLLIPILALSCVWIYKKQISQIGARSLKNRAALALRLLIVTITALALAGPSLLVGTRQAATWVLMDASDSAKTVRERMEKAIAQGLAAQPDDLSVGVIAFGGDAMVETPLSIAPAFTRSETFIDGSHTDVSGALGLAGAMLPSDAASRIVLLSDGKFENADEQAALLGARGVPVDVYKFTAEALPDAQVTAVTAPSGVYQNESFSVTVSMYSNFETQGTLVLTANRQPVQTREVKLRRGENTYVFQDVATESGIVTYEAQLIADGDERAQNNRMGAYIAVMGKPHVLIVEGRAGEGLEMQKLLTAAGMSVEMVLPAAVSGDAETLRQYDAMALVNVDADSFSDSVFSALDGYVRHLGRGLAVFGGDSSYALGNYRGSGLEKLLPITIDVRNQMDMPSLALMIVIDKSGSMDAGMFGTPRIELAKEAAMRAVEVLTPKDKVGVIAFDDASKWVVELQNAEDIAAIQNSIGTIRSGGGTAFFTPLFESMEALMDTEAQIKHVIFLTDGEPGDRGYEPLALQMKENDITLTTVAVGSGANAKLLRSLAENGGGRAYIAGEFDNIPKIFTKETYLVTGSYVQNRVFTPAITENSSLTNYEGFPKLSGYLAATEKPLTTVSMISDRDDPILAWWQYGAGRVLAWTSDTKGAWTERYLAWDKAPEFFSGMISHVLPAGQQNGELEASIEGNTFEIVYRMEDGEDTQASRIYAQIFDPDGVQTQVALHEIAPGMYEGEARAALEGAYAVRIEREQNGELVHLLEGGVVSSYSKEYDVRETDSGGALERIAKATGGRVLSEEDAQSMFSERGTRARARQSLASALLYLLLVLFLAGIAMDRLPWDRVVLALYARLNAAGQVRHVDGAEQVHQKREREPSVRRGGDKPKKPAAAPPADTAGQLLKARSDKKKL